MGAGVGIGAGLPSWSDLLKLLASDVDMSEVDREQLDKLDVRDAAGVLGRRLPHGALADAVVAHVQTEQVALVHQLLASLPVQEAVTTNYDRCFEKAWKAAGKRPRVLPAEPAAESRCWLLKLHGSVDDPERIVLSRDDYLRFEGEGVALAGIVQAMLLTRHMLFVGYSLSDDNFHRLMHQVRSAVGERPKRPGGDRFATALTPVPWRARPRGVGGRRVLREHGPRRHARPPPTGHPARPRQRPGRRPGRPPARQELPRDVQ